MTRKRFRKRRRSYKTRRSCKTGLSIRWKKKDLEPLQRFEKALSRGSDWSDQ